MTTTVKYGTQVAEVPVGGVHTLYLHEGQQASAVITELGKSGDAPADVSETEDLKAKVVCLEAEVEHLKAQLEAVSNAVKDA
jgi:uncharacterized small protein (DUF1192 family)